jgi:pimeloyl-ACP methyl ester carboxylesterase
MNIPKFTSTLLFIFCFSIFSFAQNTLTQGEHFADINGAKINYYVSGKGPICLMPSPGWGPSVDYLKNSLQPFEKYFTMVYYNTRLSGKSTGPSDPTKYSSEDLMNDMDSLRVYLKQPKVWIMGHSGGGFQVLYYGIHHSDKLYGIIALDAHAGRDSLNAVEFKKIIMKRKGEPYFEKGSNILFGKDTTKYKTSEWLQFTFPFFFHDTKYMGIVMEISGSPFSDKAADNTKASKFQTEYLFPQLHKINVPTLVVVGDDDFICDKVSQSDRIAKDIKNSHEIVIKDAGHMPWIEQPTQFFDECIQWLKNQGLKEQN